MVYESQSLGIMAVDNIKGKRQLTQSDVNLLMGVAYQTAVSIFSVMSYTKLMISEERYRSLYDNAPTPYFSIDARNGIILNCNLAAVRLLGHTRVQLLGSQWCDYFSQDADNRTRAVRIDCALKQGQPILRKEVKFVRRDGQSVWTDLSMEPFRNAAGEVVEGRCVLIDTTERKMLEQKLRHAQKMEAVGTLAGGVAHDLSNILAAIVSYPDLLLMDIEVGSPLIDPLNKIRSAGLRATVIVQDLLSLARLGLPLSEVVDFNAIVGLFMRSPELESLQIHHPKVTIFADLEENLTAIKGSTVHLLKSLMNIVNNAAEAMPDGGNIRIVTRHLEVASNDPRQQQNKAAAGRYVVVSVVDNGAGIATEDMGRIFEPFFTTKVMGRSGTGLGMAIVWATVQDHKGFIEVSSEVGTGTTIDLFFPATDEIRAPRTVTPQVENSMGHGECILIVDDEADHREIATKMLTRLGYQAVAVADAQAALAQLQQHPADLLLLDMVLDADMDGLALYRRILAIRPTQKAIIVSGFSETHRVKQALELGAGGYIKKPYALKDIAAAVSHSLRH
jgi:PAS domain S-box-containing protein